MNDGEREQWVLNDEHLYNRLRTVRCSMRTFLRKYRTEIDTHINNALAVRSYR